MSRLVAVPDIEARLVEILSAVPGSVEVWAYSSGAAASGHCEATSVQVDVRAASKKRAADLIWEARSLILDMPGQAWDDGVVSAVEMVTGPLWMPDDDGAARYTMRCTITYR